MKNAKTPDSDDRLFYSWRIVFLLPVALVVAVGILWFFREVLGLENTRVNRGFALAGSAFACGIWRWFAKSRANDQKDRQCNRQHLPIRYQVTELTKDFSK